MVSSVGSLIFFMFLRTRVENLSVSNRVKNFVERYFDLFQLLEFVFSFALHDFKIWFMSTFTRGLRAQLHNCSSAL